MRLHPTGSSASRIAARCLSIVVLVIVAAGDVSADDRDLLRFDTAKPYLMILLDTSASMNLAMGAGDVPTAGHGDDPSSRIYGAKQALFEVFEPSTDFHFGFAAFNQDGVRVVAKHWLYYLEADVGGGWPLDWPASDPDGLTAMIDTPSIDLDGDGVDDVGDGVPDTLVNDVEGDVQTLGHQFETGTQDVAGTCNSPLDLDDPVDRARANAFAKVGRLGNRDTVLWLESGNTDYRLLMSRPGNRPDGSVNGVPGDPNLHVKLDLDRVVGCLSDLDADLASEASANVKLRLDPRMDEYLMVDLPAAGGDSTEAHPGLWPWQDAVASASCETGGPFTGHGWEGNYDSGVILGDAALDPLVTDVDEFCAVPGDPATCFEVRPVLQTQPSVFGRPLDRGDMLPFEWERRNKSEFLARLAPDYADGAPDFRVSPYFRDEPNVHGLLEVADPARRPLVAAGESPIGDAILDVRCWYQGSGGSGGKNKCRDAAFADAGWADVACTYDSEFGCRRPFIVVISDGVDTCPGENPAADTASMFSHSGVRTWSINLGDPDNCTASGGGNVMKRISQNAGGECVNVSNVEELKAALQEIAGKIREEARTFASAAVPSVQATADQIIYVSRFTPLNSAAVWDGHVDAFLKPLPLDDNGRPDPSDPNHLWDAGVVLRDEQIDAVDPLGGGAGQRRVYHSRERRLEGTQIGQRRLFDPTTASSGEAVRYDLWRGLGLIDRTVADDSLSEAEELDLEVRANAVVAESLDLETATLEETGETIEYVLGDIFHSTPLIVGTPNNSRYFAQDAGADQDLDCRVDDGAASANRGYRCFVRRHQARRKLLVVGANDGMLHAFNAGIWDRSERHFDNGTGNELWAWVPRPVMPTLTKLAGADADHRFSVDGPPTAADVFIDPAHDGVPTAGDRLWRTVVVGSLREGGRGYFALDITQPDPLETNAAGDFLPARGTGYLHGCTSSGGGCGPVAYPAPLWELTDTTADSHLTSDPPAVPVLLDEDGNGQADMADSWSVPVVGRILLCEGAVCDLAATPNDVAERYVAVLGGGLDGSAKQLMASGDWLYIVDIETGKVLYKRQVEGSIPASPAAVDTDQDGFLDRIYVGTTAGRLYRADLGADAAGRVPALQNQSVTDVAGGLHLARRVVLDSTGEPAWEPRLIFDASSSGVAATPMPRPLYHQPSVLLVARLGRWAVAFGSGDREDLWSTTLPPDAEPTDVPQPGRFYVVVDDSDRLADASLPLTEADLQAVGVDEVVVDGNYLEDRVVGRRGWFLELEPDERVVTDAFALSGVTVFSTFMPDLALTDDTGAPIDGGGTCTDPQFQKDTSNRCSKSGTSRIFVVGTTSGNPFMADLSGQPTRYMEVSTFVTNPYTEMGMNKNRDADEDRGDTADDLSEQERLTMEALKDLFPGNCTFANYRIDIKTISADTRIQRIAAVPVCLVEKNWKEF